MCCYILMMYFKIITNNIDYYFYTFQGLFEIIIINFNFLHNTVSIFAFSSVFQYAIILPTMSAYITFIRLKQADDYLRRLFLCKETVQKDVVFRKNFKNFNKLLSRKIRSDFESKLAKFYRFHHSCRQSVFSQNSIFGKQLLENLLIYTPINAHLMFSILLGRIEPMTAIIFVVMILAQLSYIFGMHLIAMQYGPKLHRSAVLLRKVYMRSTNGALSVMGQVKAANTIAMLHVKNRYGITYGPAQIVTMGTFFKV